MISIFFQELFASKDAYEKNKIKSRCEWSKKRFRIWQRVTQKLCELSSVRSQWTAISINESFENVKREETYTSQVGSFKEESKKKHEKLLKFYQKLYRGSLLWPHLEPLSTCVWVSRMSAIFGPWVDESERKRQTINARNYMNGAR